jgi:3-hydroxy-9,10-secoandrosta-1,3,5(10)-triene-9,17-dione monooxygenase reductase component
MLDPQSLRRAFGNYATGIAVIGARGDDGALVGMTVNSFSSVSLDPPLVLFCPARTVRAVETYASAKFFSANILSAAQKRLSDLFARQGESKWESIGHRIGDTGVPLIPDALASFECETQAVHDAGDHLLVVGRVRAVHVKESSDALIFFRSRYRALANSESTGDLETHQAVHLGWGL